MILLLTTVLVLPLMLILGGLAIDLAVYGQRDAKLGTCADAIVTAVASSTAWVPDDPAIPTGPGHWQADLGQASVYRALNCPGAVLDAPTLTGAPPVIAVTLHDASATSFLRVIGLNSLTLGAHAAAVRRNVAEAERTEPGRSRLTK